MKRQSVLGSLLAMVVLLEPANLPANKPAPSSETGVDDATRVRFQGAYGSLPLYFIQNDGQVDERVKFYEKGSGHTTFFTKEGVCLQLVGRQKTEDRKQKTKSKTSNPKSEIVKFSFFNANKDIEIVAEGVQDGKVNYLIGNDPKSWRTNIPTYKAVVYKGLYKDIDIRFYGTNRQLEYDIIVGPGADPSNVKFAYEGIEDLRITEDGDLEIILKEGKLIQKRPYIYQEIDGKRMEIEGKFKVQSKKFKTQNSKLLTINLQFIYGFQIVSYNKDYPIIVDPVLIYSTYLGGSSNDYGHDIAVDAEGNAYITGHADSTNFPLKSPIQGVKGGVSDVFITKINASGNAFVYSTYLGGSGSDYGRGIAVDIGGNAYITGYTDSTNFPTTVPIQGARAGMYDAFVTKINASGNAFVYSTYLGGSSNDYGRDIAVDTGGNVYITGETESTDFPLKSPVQGVNTGMYDAFITKINASGNAFVYSTYLGGDNDDYGTGIAVDTGGNAYITGVTYSSTDFPLKSPIQRVKGGYTNAFVTKINSGGSSLVYSTYLGGNNYDYGAAIAVDTGGNAYITGHTYSRNFPLKSPIQGKRAGVTYTDAFVTKINSGGSSLVYSTYLGGDNWDYGTGIAVDTGGNVYITGYTYSPNFPLKSPIQAAYAGDGDAFVTKVNSSGSSIVYSTYLGGSGEEYSYGIAVDTGGNVYITGETYSHNFPLKSPIQGKNAGSYDAYDAFVTKIGEGAQ